MITDFSLPAMFLKLSTRERIVVIIGVLSLVVGWAAVKDAGQQSARADRAEADIAVACAPPNDITKACTSLRMRGVASAAAALPRR